MATNGPNSARLRPAELVKLLNSTDLGTVVSPAQIYRHFTAAGYRVASTEDRRCLHLYRYIAWLVDRKNAAAEAAASAPGGYAAHREAAAQRQADLSASGRDIGELPPVADPARREACRLDFRLFCETYFPEVYQLAWSEDHLRVIAKIQKAVLEGGLFALAMSRGSGKSSLAETAAVWAMLYGHREFVVVVGASESAALEILDSIKTELEVNEHLAADFPEVVYPIACLDGIANRCAGQLYRGERTRITWTANEIVLPTIPGAPSSGVLVRVACITGRIRGMKYKRPDGRTVRPEFVIVDDPQTTESADSVEQTRKRVRVLAGDILGLAGPGRKISGVMPCTVIRPGDMAEQILDKAKHPEWNGERCRMVYRFPRNEELWNRYADLRADELRERGTFAQATEFYRAHRAEMDEGAVVSWPARHNYDEISAIQHAMNLKLTDEAAFWAEYQNEPLPEDLGTDEQLTTDGVVNRLNGHSRGAVPVSANHVTMFVDVQKTLLFYVVCAWDDDFTGYVLDYGAWPDQRRRYFTLSDANPTLQARFPRAGLEGCIHGGLKSLTDDLLSREFTRDDGAPGGFAVGWRVLDAQYVRTPAFPRAVPQRRRRLVLVGDRRGRAGPLAALFAREMRGGPGPPGRDPPRGDPSGAGGCWPLDLTNLDRRADLPGKCWDAEGTAAYTITRRRPSGVVAHGVARMLTPLECERAFGLPDGYTAIPWHGRAVAPDWSRYRALGNTMCVNVMDWIGRRIEAAERRLHGHVEGR